MKLNYTLQDDILTIAINKKDANKFISEHLNVNGHNLANILDDLKLEMLANTFTINDLDLLPKITIIYKIEELI